MLTKHVWLIGGLASNIVITKTILLYKSNFENIFHISFHIYSIYWNMFEILFLSISRPT